VWHIICALLTCVRSGNRVQEVTGMVQHATRSGQGTFPVDNNTYNLIQMTAAKLESLEVYQKYRKDADQQTRGVIDSMFQEDWRHAEQLVDALRQALSRR
jgi:hypothetical protein